MNEPILFKGDKLLIAESFLQLLGERPTHFDNYIVTVEGIIDGPDGKILVVHQEPKR